MNNLNLIPLLTKFNFIKTNESGYTFSLNSFNERLKLQKTIFLLQESSNKIRKNSILNYSFNWYLRGPYSPNLTEDEYEIEKLIQDNPKIIQYFDNKYKSEIKEEYFTKFNNLKSKFNENFNKDWDAKDLEILSSILFIEKYSFTSCKNKMDETILELKERKPNFSTEEELNKYWEILKESSFIEIVT